MGFIVSLIVSAGAFLILSAHNNSRIINAFSKSFSDSVLLMQGRDKQLAEAMRYTFDSPDEQYEMAINRYIEDGDLLALLKAAKKRYGV